MAGAAAPLGAAGLSKTKSPSEFILQVGQATLSGCFYSALQKDGRGWAGRLMRKAATGKKGTS